MLHGQLDSLLPSRWLKRGLFLATVSRGVHLEPPLCCLWFVGSHSLCIMGVAAGQGRPQRGGGGRLPLYGPHNGCMEQWVLWAPQAPEILF